MRVVFLALCLILMVPGSARTQDAALPGLIHAPMTVTIALPDGSHARLQASVVRPDRPGRFPLIVIVHGTPGVPKPEFLATIARMSPDFYLALAVAQARHGYAVVSIMRRGYGTSDGPYAEYPPGDCDQRYYTDVGRRSAEDVIGAAEALRSEPWVDPSRVLLIGHSTGGLAVTAAAATNPPGVVGILDFAGGRGSRDRSGQVCGQDLLIEAFRTFGTTARVPALWVYAENDTHFGPDLARRMFAAYTGAGAPARLVMLPAIGSEGHFAIRSYPNEVIWPPIEAFLASLNLPH